jgi:hypothetical protein
MSDVQGVSGRRHFSPEEEAALRTDESTTSIVKRDTRTSVELHGADLPWPEVKLHQQGLGDNKLGMLKAALPAVEGAEIAGVVAHLEHAAAATRAAHLVEVGAAAAEIVVPVAAFGLGLYELSEAHAKGDEQREALARDVGHVALIGALDLPESYKCGRLDTDYKHVPKGDHSPAFHALEGLKADPKGLATLQLHADRGMQAARDLAASGMTQEAFLKSHPKVAEGFVNDAAFREGFHGFLHAKATMSKTDMADFEQRLNERDGWYAQSQTHVRA